jgi:hypothetical protein
MDLSDWFSDFLNKKLEAEVTTAGQDENEFDADDQDREDETASAYLDPEWYSKERNVKKYIPKLSVIALGKVVKLLNVIATSEAGKDYYAKNSIKLYNWYHVNVS